MFDCYTGTGQPSNAALVNNSGWNWLLFRFAKYSQMGWQEANPHPYRMDLLWLHLSNFANAGRSEDINTIDASALNNSDETWKWYATPACTGFKVPDECPYRAEELAEVSHRSPGCENTDTGCNKVLAAARFSVKPFSQALSSMAWHLPP